MKKTPTKNKTKPPRLSVIVCSFNREDLLPGCLDSLAQQALNKSDYEVIIIDNNSSDNTCKIAKQYAGENTNFHYYFEPEQGLSFARNLGLKKSRANYVGFIDDDARAPEHWLEEACKIAKDMKPDIFGGPVYSSHYDSKANWFKNEYGVRGEMGKTGWIEEGFIVGTNIFFKKTLLKKYGGFDTDLGMKANEIGYHEETKIVKRALEEKRKIFYSKELAVNDFIPDFKMSLAFYILSKYRAGRDGYKIWKSEFEVSDLLNLLKLIDHTMIRFDYALFKRNRTKYKYPENYIVEKVIDNFFHIGQQTGYFLKEGKLTKEFCNLVNTTNLLSKNLVKKDEEVRNLKQIVIKKDEGIKKKEIQINTSSSKFAISNTTNHKLQKELEDSRNKTINLNIKISELQKKLRELRKKWENTQTHLAISQNKITEKAELIKFLKDQVGYLQNDIQNRIDRKSNELAKIKKEKEDLKAENKHKFDNLTRKLKRKNHLISQLNKELTIVYTSYSFKTGRLILTPFKLLRKITKF